MTVAVLSRWLTSTFSMSATGISHVFLLSVTTRWSPPSKTVSANPHRSLLRKKIKIPPRMQSGIIAWVHRSIADRGGLLITCHAATQIKRADGSTHFARCMWLADNWGNPRVSIGLALRLSNAVRRRQTKLLYPNHRLPSMTHGRCDPRSLEPIVRRCSRRLAHPRHMLEPPNPLV